MTSFSHSISFPSPPADLLPPGQDHNLVVTKGRQAPGLYPAALLEDPEDVGPAAAHQRQPAASRQVAQDRPEGVHGYGNGIPGGKSIKTCLLNPNFTRDALWASWALRMIKLTTSPASLQLGMGGMSSLFCSRIL